MRLNLPTHQRFLSSGGEVPSQVIWLSLLAIDLINHPGQQGLTRLKRQLGLVDCEGILAWTLEASMPLRRSATATCPLRLANCSGVTPDSVLASTSSQWASKTSTTLAWPPLAAACSGVAPELALASTEAPRASSTSTTAPWPAWAARCNGVSPLAVFALIRASLAMNHSASAVWSLMMAHCSGVVSSPRYCALRSAPDEPLGHRLVALIGRQVQRREAEPIFYINVGPLGDDLFDP